MALGYAGTALLFGALWPFLTLVPALAMIDFGVIRREERNLERSFGGEYRDHRTSTRRWL